MMLTSPPSTDWQRNWRRGRTTKIWPRSDGGGNSSTTGVAHLLLLLSGSSDHLCAEDISTSGRWSKFHGNLSNYKKKLERALVVHALIRELEEVRERANEKVSPPSYTVGPTASPLTDLWRL